jgi:hypothetical protein
MTTINKLEIKCLDNDRRIYDLVYGAISRYVSAHSEGLEEGWIEFNYICDLSFLNLASLSDGDEIFRVTLNGKKLCIAAFTEMKDPIRGLDCCVIGFEGKYFPLFRKLLSRGFINLILNKYI